MFRNNIFWLLSLVTYFLSFSHWAPVTAWRTFPLSLTPCRAVYLRSNPFFPWANVAFNSLLGCWFLGWLHCFTILYFCSFLLYLSMPQIGLNIAYQAVLSCLWIFSFFIFMVILILKGAIIAWLFDIMMFSTSFEVPIVIDFFRKCSCKR